MIRPILAIILIVVGIATLLTHFSLIAFLDAYNIPLLAASFFIIFQLYHLVRNRQEKTHPLFGILIPGVFIIISGTFIASLYLPILSTYQVMLGAVTGSLMFSEGIYSLH